MKKYFTIIILFIFLLSSSTVFARDFISSEEAVNTITTYYKEILNTVKVRVYLLEIITAEENSNIIYVYFLKDRHCGSDRDYYYNIYSDKTPVQEAVFIFSYLNKLWRLDTIREVKKKLVFKVDC